MFHALKTHYRAAGLTLAAGLLAAGNALACGEPVKISHAMTAPSPVMLLPKQDTGFNFINVHGQPVKVIADLYSADMLHLARVERVVPPSGSADGTMLNNCLEPAKCEAVQGSGGLVQWVVFIAFETPLTAHGGRPVGFETPLTSFETPLTSINGTPLGFETPLTAFETPLTSYGVTVITNPEVGEPEIRPMPSSTHWIGTAGCTGKKC